MSKFNWHDYIEISEAFGPDRPLIEEALNRIAATGADGEELIRKAYENNPLHDKVKIYGMYEPNKPLFSSPITGTVTWLESGCIQVDPVQIRTIYLATADGPKQMSLNGFLVHELFHHSDWIHHPEMYEFAMLDEVNANEHLTIQQNKDISRAYKRWSKTLSDPEEIEKHIAQELNLSPSFMKEKWQTSGIPRKEREATAYTDVFMAKHFPDEAWRGDYRNGFRMVAPKMQPVLSDVKEGTYLSGVYESETIRESDLGQMSQPTLSDSRSVPPNPSIVFKR